MEKQRDGETYKLYGMDREQGRIKGGRREERNRKEIR